MSDLCVLTASLLVQGKIPGWKLAAPSPAQNVAVSQSSDVNRVCQSRSSTAQMVPAVALHRPEFSHWAKQVSTGRLSKPVSGRQLYAQRVAALKTGHLYTRLSPDSFASVWQQTTYQPTYDDWVNLLRHEAKAVARGQGSQRMTVLLGDSLAQWFPSDQLSRDRFWLNQGISGDTTSSVLNRLSLLDQTNPDSVYIMVGINDLRQGMASRDILNNLQQIIRRLKATHPYTQIYVSSILPTRLEDVSVNRIRRLNYNISYLARQEGVSFVNLQPAFADDEGRLQPQLTTDGLHLNARGYKVWQVAMTPIF